MLQVQVPKDSAQVSLPIVPSLQSLAVTNNGSLASAASITLQATTSLIEVNTLSQGVYMRWGAVPTTTAFDEYIQAGFTRHYVVPINPTTGLRFTTVQFLQQAASATVIVIEK